MHPIVGPVAEAESLYVKGLDLVARAGRMDRFCVWDIGMGAAANALVATRALLGATPNIEIISFDHTAGALRFAAEHRDDFQYVADFIPEINELLADRDIAFERDGTKVCWRFLEGDFGRTPGARKRIAETGCSFVRRLVTPEELRNVDGGGFSRHPRSA